MGVTVEGNEYKAAMIEKARHCDSCLCWLQYCEAECCKGFQCPVGESANLTIRNGVLRIPAPMNPDKKWYFELHGVRVDGNVLNIPKAHCVFSPRLVTVNMWCKLLTKDNLCAGHPDKKPEICTGLTMETTKGALPMGSEAPEDGYRLTPNCLFNYKKRA
jgi:Fe-S-cluster containining protein